MEEESRAGIFNMFVNIVRSIFSRYGSINVSIQSRNTDQGPVNDVVSKRFVKISKVMFVEKCALQMLLSFLPTHKKISVHFVIKS